MKHYLSLAPRYLAAHKRKTRLTVLSVAMAVTLVVGIFSMLDTLVKFERVQVLRDEGNYHFLVRKPSEKEMRYIDSRVEVKSTGSFKDLGEGKIDGENCAFGSIDDRFAANLNFTLVEGSHPRGAHEIMLEKWVMESRKPALTVGDKVSLAIPGRAVESYTISGIYSDLGATKAAGIPGVFLSAKAAEGLVPKNDDFFILFKEGVSVMKAEGEIRKALSLPDNRVARNERLLAFTLQSRNSRVRDMYGLGVILFCLVLVTGVVMIYNTFNITVMERVRHFGLLRCIGASSVQIRRVIRREAFSIALRAIPFGVIAGILMTVACSVVLKYVNSHIYGKIPLSGISPAGIGVGVVMGFLTVYLASLLPAKKASRVSPVNALTGSNEIRVSKRRKLGLLSKILHAEIAIGINNAVNKRKTLFLMACSIAFSVTLFLGFNILVNPEYMGMKAIKAYTADISVTAGEGIRSDLFGKLSSIEGVRRVYGRMAGYVNATFAAARLTDTYKKQAGGIMTDETGFLIPAENSWLLSYDKAQFEWMKEYLMEGEADESRLNAENGIIAVEKNWRRNDRYETVKLKLGDKVRIRTAAGEKEFSVMGVCDSIPYSSEEQTMTAFITTEKLFTEIMGDRTYGVIDIQLGHRNREQTVAAIKELAGSTAKVLDKRQYNEQARNAFMTVAVFIYGFVGVIVLISILNIINTMNTSVAAKTRYLGVMRAVGMSGSQLTVMVITEAAIYSLCGCIAGCTFGVLLRKAMTDFFLAEWKFPLLQVILIFAFALLASALSVIAPLRRIKARSISEVTAAL